VNTFVSAALIGAIVLIFTVQSFFSKLYTKYYPGDPSAVTTVFSIVGGITCIFFGFVLSDFSFTPSLPTVLFAILNTGLLILFNVCMLGAARTGPYSILMVCKQSGGFMLPTVVAVFYGDRLSVLQWFALFVIVIAIYMATHKDEADGKTTKTQKWFYLYCAGLFFANGAYGSVLNVQQLVAGADEKEEMLMLTNFLMSLVMIGYGLFKRRGKFLSDFRQTKKSFFFMAVAAVLSATAGYIMVYLIQFVNITMLYAFNHSGILLCSIFCSRVILKEKLSRLNYAGCFLLCLGLSGLALL